MEGGRRSQACRRPTIGLTEHASERRKLPHILVTLGDREVNAAVDCFSSDCFLHPELLLQGTAIESATSAANLAGEDTHMLLIGKAHIKIRIQGYSFNVLAWVAPTSREPLILGYPWLTRQRAILDFHHGIIHFGVHERLTVRLSNAPVRKQIPFQTGLSESHQELPPEWTTEFHELIQRFGIVFKTDGRLSQTCSTRHSIQLMDEKPFRVPLRRYSEEKCVVIREQLESMLAEGIVEPCTSPYCSPIVIARKKDGRPRFCINYRRINEITEDTAQPILRIPHALKDLGTTRIFSTLDLKSGYW